MTILLITGIEAAQKFADTVADELGAKVDRVACSKAAFAVLSHQEFAAVVMDDTIAECDPDAANLLWELAGLAVPVQVNFGIADPERLVREIRAALHRREREQALARKAAVADIESELKSTVAALLLHSELALAGCEAGSATGERLRIVVELAGSLRRQVAASDMAQSTA